VEALEQPAMRGGVLRSLPTYFTCAANGVTTGAILQKAYILEGFAALKQKGYSLNPATAD
jgi:hypothetical protein